MRRRSSTDHTRRHQGDKPEVVHYIVVCNVSTIIFWITAALSARFLVIDCSLGMNNQYSIKYLVGRRMALNEKTVFSFPLPFSRHA